MSEQFVKSSMIVLPAKLPFWEIAKVFDDYFDNTKDPVPVCAENLHALIRDNPRHAQTYLMLLESRKKVVLSTLLSTSGYYETQNEEDDGTPHTATRH